MADSNENAKGEAVNRKRIHNGQGGDNLNSEEFEDEEEIEIIGPIRKKRRRLMIESSEDEEENGKGDENIDEGEEDEEDEISAKSDISNFTLADEEDGEEKENVDKKEEDESEGNEEDDEEENDEEEENEESDEESDADVDELDGTVEGANARYEALPLREMPTNEQLEDWARHAIWKWKAVTMRVVKVREINAAYDWGSHERKYFTKVLLSNDESTKVELQAWNEGQAKMLLDSLEEFQTYTFRGIKISKISPSNAKYNQGNLPITFGYHKFSTFEPCRT